MFQGLVVFLLAQEWADVVTGGGEEAGKEFAFGGESQAAASTAEGLSDGGDDADFGGAVAVLPAFGGFAGVSGREGREREFTFEDGEDLGGGDDLVHLPSVRFADIHELDESESHLLVFGPAGEREDFLFVDAALDDGVDLDR